MDNNINTKIKHRVCPYDKTKELGSVLGHKGTLELLHFLEKQPRRYKELDEYLYNLSQKSISRRLKILTNLNILKQYPLRSENRETHVYDFTNRGKTLITFIKSYEKEMKLPIEQQKIIRIEK